MPKVGIKIEDVEEREKGERQKTTFSFSSLWSCNRRRREEEEKKESRWLEGKETKSHHSLNPGMINILYHHLFGTFCRVSRV
jgi:hypothetical protein